jgi:hypothetical protein
MPQAVYILFGVAFTCATAYSMGVLLLSRLDLGKLYREERRIFAFLTGCALLSMLVFLICACHVARKGVFLVVGLAAITAAWRLRPDLGQPLPALPRPWRNLFLVIYSAFGFLYFFNAMAPEFSPDGSSYHLGLVARYLREHGFHRIVTTMYANLSQGIEMLFLFAFSFGRHSSAAMVHLAFLAILPLAMICYARRFGFGPMGVVAALLMFASPVVGIDGTSAYNDVAAACVLFVLFYALQIWADSRAYGLVIITGLLAGFAYAVKYTIGIALMYALVFIALKSRRALVPLTLCAAAMAAPWMIKNIVLVQNPIAPFGNKLFPNQYRNPDAEAEYRSDMAAYEGQSYAQIPLELAVHGSHLGGLIGPVVLLLPLSLLALRWPAGRQLLIPAFLFSLTFPLNLGTRFLIPALPFWWLALALAFRNASGAAVTIVLFHALAGWPAVLRQYCDPYAWRLDKFPIRPALRIVKEEKFLAERYPPYVYARMVEMNVPADKKVFSFGGVISDAYTSRDVMVGFQTTLSRTIREILWTPLMRDFQPTRGLDFHFPPVTARKIRVVETTLRGSDIFSISEFRIYSREHELPRESTWRLRAHPNPWDVQRAFDNSPITRWSSREAIGPGMFVEVDFGRAETIDFVRLECARDQYQVRLKLEMQDSSGAWKSLGDAPAETDLPRYSGLRRAAVEEMKRLGVEYILVHDDDLRASDFEDFTDLWGLRLVDAKGAAKLYKAE